ncbi:MAG: hypothetical protein ACLRSY_03255 [Acutalibacter sp.]
MAARYTARGQALLEKLGNALPGLRPLAENDFPALLALYKSNPFYLSISQEGPPTLEDCQEDAAALPPGRGKEHKLFLGLFQESVLAAVLDLVEGYPEEGTLYLGLLELAGPLQERALTHIFSALPKRPGLRGSSAYVLPAWRKTSRTGLLGRHGL